MEVGIIFAAVVVILNILLFFKVWGMTNDVNHIFNFLLEKSGYVMKRSASSGEVSFEKKEE